MMISYSPVIKVFPQQKPFASQDLKAAASKLSFGAAPHFHFPLLSKSIVALALGMIAPLVSSTPALAQRITAPSGGANVSQVLTEVKEVKQALNDKGKRIDGKILETVEKRIKARKVNADAPLLETVGKLYYCLRQVPGSYYTADTLTVYGTYNDGFLPFEALTPEMLVEHGAMLNDNVPIPPPVSRHRTPSIFKSLDRAKTPIEKSSVPQNNLKIQVTGYTKSQDHGGMYLAVFGNLDGGKGRKENLHLSPLPNGKYEALARGVVLMHVGEDKLPGTADDQLVGETPFTSASANHRIDVEFLPSPDPTKPVLPIIKVDGAVNEAAGKSLEQIKTDVGITPANKGGLIFHYQSLRPQ